MPQIQINSANITSFGYTATVDIYNRSITFNIAPFTSGSGLAFTKVAFSVVDSVGLTLASINWAAPQIPNPSTTTSWVLDLSDYPFIFLFQSYNIIAAIQDQNGTVYQTPVVLTTICQPNNLDDEGYVPGMFSVTADCVNNVLTIKEFTLLVYNGLQPITVTKSGVLSYPTGTIAAVNFTTTPFTNNVVYTGQYNVNCTTVGQYAIGNDIYVNVTYITNNIFPVTCKNKMSDLLCCIYDVQQTSIKKCNDATGKAAKQKLADITPYFLSGWVAESTGKDATFEYEYIKKYLNCSCGNSSLSQNEFTPINPAVNSIVLTGRGGTTIPSPTVTGNTQTYFITSDFYQVVKGNPSDNAFTITPDTSTPNTVKYLITFNYDVMAGYILTAIADDPSLIVQFNNLIQTAVNAITGLNGKCVIDLTQVTYIITQNATISTGVTSIVINGILYPAPTGLLALNAASFATWLNSLTLGTFTVTAMGGVVTVQSVNNTHVVSTITFTNPDVTLQFTATNFTLVQVLQAIINYLCNISALQVALGNNLSLCTFDYNGSIVPISFTDDNTQNDFNAGVADAICNITGRINTLTGLTCAKFQALFNDYPNAVFDINNDRFLTVVGGNCTTLTAQQQALAFIAAVNAFANVKAAFCAINCATPVSCPDVANVNLGLISQTIIGLYGLTWAATPTASQTVTVRYRMAGNLTWITANSGLLILPNGNISGSSPYQITGLTAGTSYQVWVQNNCGGNGFIGNITTPSSTLYTANYLVGSVLSTICGNAPVTLYSSVPFGIGVTLYTNSGLSTPVTGFAFVAPITTGAVYALNTGTGVVGALTGNTCSSGTQGTYILGNSTGSICSNAAGTYYTNGAFAVGGILYVDSALTTPVTGSSFVVNVATGHIFNLNSATGAIGSDTGLACSSTTVIITTDLGGTQISGVTGIVGFTPTPSFPLSTGGTITGTHSGFTGTVAVTVTGTPAISGNVTLQVNGVIVQCIPVSAAGTYTFNSRTYASTDVLQIEGNTGSC